MKMKKVAQITGLSFLLLLGLSSSGFAKDTDHDGLSDVEERRRGTRINRADSDGDGLPDGYEVYKLRTNPRRADSDGDDVEDGDEKVCNGTDPRDEDSDDDDVADGDEDVDNNGHSDRDDGSDDPDGDGTHGGHGDDD